MGYAVLGAWVIQAVVGLSLMVSWARHARGQGAPFVVTHVALMVGYLVPWTLFLITGSALWPWVALAVLFAGIPFGETQMVARSRRVRGESNPGLRDYWVSMGTAMSGRLPPRVTFHALFSAAVFFGSLGVAIGATVARA